MELWIDGLLVCGGRLLCNLCGAVKGKVGSVMLDWDGGAREWRVVYFAFIAVD